MKTFVTSGLLLIVCSTVCAAAPPKTTVKTPLAVAPVDGRLTRQPTVSLADLRDQMQDYDLYFADPATLTGWYLKWTYSNGEVLFSSAYSSHQAAQDALMHHLFRGSDPRNSLASGSIFPSVDVIESSKEPDWILFDTYETYSEAAADAQLFELAGLLTKIKSHSTLSLMATGQ